MEQQEIQEEITQVEPAAPQIRKKYFHRGEGWGFVAVLMANGFFLEVYFGGLSEVSFKLWAVTIVWTHISTVFALLAIAASIVGCTHIVLGLFKERKKEPIPIGKLCLGIFLNGVVLLSAIFIIIMVMKIKSIIASY